MKKAPCASRGKQERKRLSPEAVSSIARPLTKNQEGEISMEQQSNEVISEEIKKLLPEATREELIFVYYYLRTKP